MITEYIDDELPLPSFIEVFGDGNSNTILASNDLSLSSKKKSGRRSGSRANGPAGDESTGRWTPDEQRRFLEGLMLYGKDWKKMAPLIKTRTLVQIRTHAQKVFKKMGLKSEVSGGSGSKIKRGRKRSIDDGDLDEADDDNSNPLEPSNVAIRNVMNLNPNIGMIDADDDDDIDIDDNNQANILSQIATNSNNSNNNNNELQDHYIQQQIQQQQLHQLQMQQMHQIQIQNPHNQVQAQHQMQQQSQIAYEVALQYHHQQQYAQYQQQQQQQQLLNAQQHNNPLVTYQQQQQMQLQYQQQQQQQQMNLHISPQHHEPV